MIGSVRARLTLAVSVVVGVIVIAGALIAPRVVRTSLIDDRLDAQRDIEAAELAAADTPFDMSGLGSAELTALFGPEIAQVTSELDALDALAPLRDVDPSGDLYVLADPGVVAIVTDEGRVRVQAGTQRIEAVPMVSRQRLVRLAADYGLGTDSPFPFGDDTTFEAFIDDLDGWLTVDLGEHLDPRVFDELPGLGAQDDWTPRALYDLLQSQLDQLPSAEPAAQAPAAPTADEVVVGTRVIGGHPMLLTATTDGIDNSVARVRTLLWSAVPVAMLAAGLLTWLLAGRSLRPVAAITERTRRIRSSTLHERVPVPNSRDEIAALATEMNTMLDRVQREDERRRQFVSDASHELRSPIATIRAQAEAALADDHQRELAQGVLVEAERMGSLVDDLLSLARHDEQLAPPGGIVDLDDVVYQEAARARRVPVDVRGVSAGQVRGRLDELGRVVVHLLDNAARHAASTVTVGLTTGDDGSVTLTVDDDGPGIPLDMRERVFERFVRLDDARARDGGGAGLGLAVAATVVKAAGGTIWAGDSPLGGARLQAVFPPASGPIDAGLH